MSYITHSDGDDTPGIELEHAVFMATGAAIGFFCGRVVGVAFSGTAVNGAVPLTVAGAAAGDRLWRHLRDNRR